MATDAEYAIVDAQVIQPLADTENIADPEVYQIPLTYANAEEVAQTLNDFFREMQGQSRRGGFGGGFRSAQQQRDSLTTITAETQSNTLIVACTPKTKELIDDLLEKIDTDEPAGGPREMEMFVLKYMDAPDMLSILQEFLKINRREREDPDQNLPWWMRGPSSGRKEAPIVLSGDTRLTVVESQNAIIAVAKPDKLAEIREKIHEFDQPSAIAEMTPKRIQIQYGNPSSIVSTLNQLFVDNAARRSGSDVMRTTIVADESSRSIIIKARPSEYAQIEQMVASMDTPDVDIGTGDIRLIQVASGVDVESLAREIERIINEAERNTRRRDKNYKEQLVTIGADMRTNTLLVSAPATKFESIQSLVAQLAALGPAGGMSGAVIRTRNISPADAQRMIQDLQSQRSSGGRSNRGRRGGRRRGDADWPRDRHLLPPYWHAVAPLSVQLAIVQAAGAAVFGQNEPAQPIRIRPRDKQREDPRLQQLRATTQTATSQPAELRAQHAQAEPSSNLLAHVELSGAPISVQVVGDQLIVVGPAEDVRLIQQLIELADQGAERTLRYVKLNNAKAADLAKSITQVFREMAQQPGQQPRGDDKVEVVADTRSNSLFVVATDKWMNTVLNLIQQSDSEASVDAGTIRPFFLANRLVKDVQPVLEQIVRNWITQRGGDPSQISVTIDEMANAIFVTAGEKDLEEIANIIDVLDASPEDADGKVRGGNMGTANIMLYPLRVAKADELALLINKMLEDAKTGKTPLGHVIRELRILDDNGNPIVSIDLNRPMFAFGDPGTNTLVMGGPSDVLMLMKLIVQRFDVEPLRHAVEMDIVVLKHADAGELADSIKAMLDEGKKLT
ncbi:MAG: secretin N-terminal domain-containing protein, partial [Phycisphaerae bacterium]